MKEQNKQPTKFYQTNRQDMKWYVFDAKGKTLGRFASEVSKVLRGKHKPTYTPNADVGDGVIVINAKDIVVSGMKEAQKEYISHSLYIGGLKRIPYRTMIERFPERVIEHAVRGMMPKNKLGRHMYRKLRVFKEDKHEMQAQQPVQAMI